MCVVYDAHGVAHYIGDYGVDNPDQLEIEFPENYAVRPTNKAPIVCHEDMQHWQVNKQLDYNGNGKELIKPVDNPVSFNGSQKSLF